MLKRETNFPCYIRKSEFSLGLLLETGVIQDTLDAKEYYTRSANKGYAPAQIQLALILLQDNSPEAMSWLRSAARLVRHCTCLSNNNNQLTFTFFVHLG
jgi:TPR repeat protein